jgi:hypothetical protein
VRSQVEKGNHGKIVAINIETGAFEVDASEVAACVGEAFQNETCFKVRPPEAQIWIIRIGSRHVRRLGGRRKRAA